VAASAPKEKVPEDDACVVREDQPPRGLNEILGAEHTRPSTGCHVEVAHYTQVNWGSRHSNEDRWMSRAEAYAPSGGFHTLGVMDGHDSDTASDTVASMLPGVLGKLLKDGRSIVEAYTECMAELEEALKKLHSSAGTCVLSCTIVGRYVWCANLGDCRATLIPLHTLPEADGCEGESSPSALPPAPRISPPLYWLSQDQKASSPSERRRIEAAGGTVIDGRVEGLEPSRTLGDFDVKTLTRSGVISIVPEVRRYELGDGKRLAQAIMVCATDGVWDVMTGQDVCNLITARKELVKLQATIGSSTEQPDLQPLKDLAEDLVQFSIAKGSRDDCTALVAMLSVPPHVGEEEQCSRSQFPL